MAALDVSYTEERSRRLVYRDEGLHLEVLQLVFALIFTQQGQLDGTYCDQYPWEHKLQVRYCGTAAGVVPVAFGYWLSSVAAWCVWWGQFSLPV